MFTVKWVVFGSSYLRALFGAGEDGQDVVEPDNVAMTDDEDCCEDVGLPGPIPDMEDEEEGGEKGGGAVFAGQLHCCSGSSDVGRARHCSEGGSGGGGVLLEIMWEKPISNVRGICRFDKMIGVRVVSLKSSEQNGSEFT